MRTLLLFVALAPFFVCSAWAQALAVGSVKTLKGEAFVTTGGRQVRAALDAPVYAGSQIQTGARSAIGIVFNDATVMSFGPDTVVSVDDYLYDPRGGNNKLLSKLTKGSMNYLSGALAKLQPGAVSIVSRTGTLGIRGTHILVFDNGVRSYVTLVANPDGTWGKVQVQGPLGTHQIEQVNFSAPLDGSVAPSLVDGTVLQADFAEALAASPAQPPLPSAPGGSPAGVPAGAGAPASVVAATGGLSAGVVSFGVLAVGVVAESVKGSSGTTGTR